MTSVWLCFEIRSIEVPSSKCIGVVTQEGCKKEAGQRELNYSVSV